MFPIYPSPAKLPLGNPLQYSIIIIGSSAKYQGCHGRWILSKFEANAGYISSEIQSMPDQPTLEPRIQAGRDDHSVSTVVSVL
jgi:hypothetical protein